MSLDTLVQTLAPILDSKVFAALITATVSAPLAAYVGLMTFRHQAKELIDGAVAWKWVHGYNGSLAEEPYLVIQNRSSVPAFVVRARFLRGLFARREAKRYPFSYDDPTDENYPLEIKAEGVTAFPLSRNAADNIVKSAPVHCRAFGYIFKRNYLWIEVFTISGRRVLIPANDVTSFQARPLWLERRWVRES